MTDRLVQARAEAERQYETGHITFAQAHQPGGFLSGVAWADANPAPRTITPDQREELMYKLAGIEMMFMGPDVDMILDFLGIQVEEE